MDRPANVEPVFERADRTLWRASTALADFMATPDPRRKVFALQSVLIQGHAVTAIVRHLKRRVSGFEEWYAPWRQEMENDPLLKYLYNLRSKSLKQGEDDIAAKAHTAVLQLPDDLGPRPDNAIAYFISAGGAGWKIRLEDGSVEKVYVALPESALEVYLTFGGCPTTHLGSTIPDRSAGAICSLYLAYLRRFVEAAKSQPWRSIR